MEIKLATITCKSCRGEYYIKTWKIGLSDSGQLVRACPMCNKEVVV